MNSHELSQFVNIYHRWLAVIVGKYINPMLADTPEKLKGVNTFTCLDMRECFPYNSTDYWDATRILKRLSAHYVKEFYPHISDPYSFITDDVITRYPKHTEHHKHLRAVEYQRMRVLWLSWIKNIYMLHSK